MEELEKLLEGANSENTPELMEPDQTRRVTLMDSTSPVEFDKNLANVDLFVDSSSHTLDLVTIYDSLEEQTVEEGKGMEVQDAEVACLDTIPFGEGLNTEKDEDIKGRRVEVIDHSLLNLKHEPLQNMK